MDRADGTDEDLVTVRALHRLRERHLVPGSAGDALRGWLPEVETSSRSTPCAARMPAKRTVSSDRHDGSPGSDASSQSVAEMLHAQSANLDEDTKHSRGHTGRRAAWWAG